MLTYLQVACADQLDCFIAALQAVQDASPSGLVDHNGQPHILLLTGPPGVLWVSEQHSQNASFLGPKP